MEKDVVRIRRILCTVAMVLALCAGFGFAAQDGIGSAEAKQAVKLAKSQVRMVKGEKVRLQLRGAKGKAVWKSKDKTVASVDKNGTVKAKKSGKTKISVKYGKKSYLCTVWVEAPKINKKSITLKAGAKSRLKISGTKQAVSWSCGKKEIVSVNQKGVVTAKKAGTATVIAKIGTKKFQCKVTVKPKDDKKPAEDPDEKDPAENPDDKKPAEDMDEKDPAENPDNKKPTEDPGNKEPIWEEGLVMRIKEGNIIPEGQPTVTVQIENHSVFRKDMSRNLDMYIEEDGEWKLFNSPTVTDDMIYINPGETLEESYPLWRDGRNCLPGKYCIRKYMGGKAALEAEFEIVARTEPAQDFNVWIKEGEAIPFGQKYITIVIENPSNVMKWTDYGYHILMKQGDEWIPVPMNVAFPDVMVGIKPGETREIKCSLEDEMLNGKLQPGEYHVIVDSHVDAYFRILEAVDPAGRPEMIIKGDSVIPYGQDCILFQIINHSTVTQLFSRSYDVYVKKDGAWVLVPLDYCFTCDIVEVEPGETWEIGCPLKNEDGSFYPPGQYLFKKGDFSIEFEILGS